MRGSRLRREGLLRAGCRGATQGAMVAFVAVAGFLWFGLRRAVQDRTRDSQAFALLTLPLMLAGLLVGAAIGVIRELRRKPILGEVREVAG